MSKTKNIAVVEDEAAIQQVLVEWLKTEGFNAFGVTTGTEAIEMIPKKLPDLILLDIILPEKNGFEVMKELAQKPETAKIPIVILTNLEDDEERKLALSMGARGYLIKAGSDFAAMKKIIDKVLKNSNSHNKNHRS